MLVIGYAMAWLLLLGSQVHSLDDQKKLPPAAARCASENQNYACEYDQCSPALMMTFAVRMCACCKFNFSLPYHFVAYT